MLSVSNLPFWSPSTPLKPTHPTSPKPSFISSPLCPSTNPPFSPLLHSPINPTNNPSPLLHLPNTHQRPQNLPTLQSTPHRANTNSARIPTTATIISHTDEPHSAIIRRDATIRAQRRIRLIALERLLVKANTRAACFRRADAVRGAVFVAETVHGAV
jgi:hypothetical protein